MIQKNIKINNINLSYILKTNCRAKNIRLSLYNDGRLVVVKPKRFSEKNIEKLILEKSSWILERIKKLGKIKPQLSLVENRNIYLKYKEPARRLVEDKIRYFNKIYNFKFNRISIKNQKTCWGSCSRQGNLNFNYKILFLPEKLRDYIIVHELCHLKELNHSSKFWNLLFQIIPDYLEVRRELKKNKI